MIESPVLVTLDHSLCVYCKTIWSSLARTLIWCSCQLGEDKEGDFQDITPAFIFTAFLLTTIQHWRVPIYVATNLKNLWMWRPWNATSKPSGNPLPYLTGNHEYVQSIHCSDPFAKRVIHIVKQQEVVTYVSPVEVFVNGIKRFWSAKIVCDCFIILFWMSWLLGLQDLKVEFKDCVTEKELAVFKKHKI